LFGLCNCLHTKLSLFIVFELAHQEPPHLFAINYYCGGGDCALVAGAQSSELLSGC